MPKFKVGDRVRCIDKDNRKIREGMVGTVKENSDAPYVNWDESVDGHGCYGLCKDKHGWCMIEEEIELISTPHIRKAIVKVPTKENWIAVVKQAIEDGCEKWGDDGEEWDTYKEKMCLRITEDGLFHYGTEGGGYASDDYPDYIRLTTQEYLNKFKQSSGESNKPRTKIMKKKYILLKDTPELKKGAIIKEECEDGDQDYVCRDKKFIKHWTKKWGDLGIVFDRAVVEKQPDWFEKIEVIEVPIEQVTKVKKFIKSLK